MFAPAEIHTLLKAGEGSTVEFKVSTPFPEKLARLISSFANASGGTLLVGIKEPNTISGTDPKHFENFVQRALSRLHGEVQSRHFTVEVDGKTVGVLQVSPAKLPVAAPEGYFRRVDDSDQPLSPAELVARMSAIPDHSEAITSLSETIAAQSKEIEKLRESFEDANSLKKKIFYALLGAAATAVVKLVLAALGV